MKMSKVEYSKLLTITGDICAQAMLIEMGAISSKDKMIAKIDELFLIFKKATIEDRTGA